MLAAGRSRWLRRAAGRQLSVRAVAEDVWSGTQCASKNRAKTLRTKQKGMDILNDPLWNKGMAFSVSERDRLHLRGLLPPRVKSIEAQQERIMRLLRAEPDPIKKNLQLQDLHSRNETLYHRILVEHTEELAPLIYTPTVGHVCQQFGAQFSRSRGMYFSSDDRGEPPAPAMPATVSRAGRETSSCGGVGEFSTMVFNWPHDDVHVICVTDGSRILGLALASRRLASSSSLALHPRVGLSRLGDLGAHGMGIPIGKLALYAAAGGIAPHRVMPVVLDVGTNNQALLDDPDYVGVRERRLEGAEYYDMVDEFMEAVFERWPQVVVQFEDFETSKAIPLLAKYRHRYRCFNDDIQGTGCVTLAGVIAAARNAGKALTDMSFLCAGAGSAGLGVCAQIVDGMVEAGMSREEAMRRFVICTSQGAIGRADGAHGDPNHARGLNVERAPWQNDAVSDGTPMSEVVSQFKPTCLLGLAAQPAGLFTEGMVREMASYCDSPVVMPMSNPTAKSECTPQQAYEWSDGRAIVATGSPFAPVSLPDGRTFIPSQCNNMYIFPGVGLAASVAGVQQITDGMLYAAAVACVDAMTPEEVADGRTFPDISRIRQVSHTVACNVIEKAMAEGVGTKLTKKQLPDRAALESFVRRKMYYPGYVPLVDPSQVSVTRR